MWRTGGVWRVLVKVLLVFVGRRMEFAVDFIRKKYQLKSILKVKSLH